MNRPVAGPPSRRVARSRWTPVALCLAVLAALLVAPDSAAAQTDVIRGKVTNQEGLPLPNVRVTATSIPGNVTRETRTNAQGAFQIAFPNGSGDYIMSYALIGYQFRQFQLKRLADEDVLVGDARLNVIQLDTVRIVEANQQRVNRNETTPDVGGTEKPVNVDDLPPEVQGDIAAMAASLPGVLLVPGLDGGADGFSVMGLGTDQNNVTLNGLQLDANGLPRDAGVSSSLVTSPYDPSRGGFSGASFNIRSSSGGNYASRGMSFVLNAPQLMWTDAAGRALGNEFTNMSLGGVLSGPIKRNRSFYNVSYQLGRRSSDNQTLLDTDPLGLQTAGIASDSVERFVSILNGRGVPVLAGPGLSSRINDNGSFFGSLDWSPPNSTSGHSFNVTFNGSWGKQRPLGTGATSLASAGGERTNWGGGLQARHSGYLKMLLSETSAGISTSRNHGAPYIELPSGRVRVNSIFADSTNSVQTLSFGGNQGLSSSSQSITATAQNTLSWFDDANKHRIKLTTEVRFSGNSQEQASNLLGTFWFNSLEDLEALRPSSFSRTLTARERSTGHYSAAISIGDSYRRTQDLQLQYGLRVDAAGYTRTPAYNPAVEQAFGRRNDRVPAPVVVSPRFGFSWTVGRQDEIEEFFGASRRPRAVIRGGIGVFANSSSAGQIGSALDNTGLPSGVQQIVCVGPAVPIPDWEAYSDDPSLIPTQCADGTSGGVFSNSAPNVTLFARNFKPQQSVRSNLSWSGQVLDGRFNASVEGSYSLNVNQQRSFDLNFDAQQRFTLDDGRPVFVNPTSIVPTSGSIASRDARKSQNFARVSEMRSDLQSRTAQLSFRLNPITRGPSRFGWSAAYTYSHIREQVSGFSSTAGDPLLVTWARSGQGPHQFNYSLRYNFFRAVEVRWNGTFRSGSSFTPMVAGDINGDGYSNDRAFIYSPDAAGDTALASGMRQLLAGASDRTRECLEGQLGQIASRNSCVGPWSSSANLQVQLDRARFRMPSRANIQFSLSNPLGAADLLVNGSGNLKGWGQNPSVDQSLLHVRGFDPAAQRYRYEVNQRFGASRPQFLTLRNPVTLTMTVKYDLGPTRERQNLTNQLRSGRSVQGMRLPESNIRSMGVNSVSNPMATILRQQDTLKLTTLQADSIAVMNRRYNYRADSIWSPVAKFLASLPNEFETDEAYSRYMRARQAQIDMLIRLAPVINELLTPEQKRKLPQGVTNMLDPRYLSFIRHGNGTYR